MKNYFLFFILLFTCFSLNAQQKSANVAYQDEHVRFTVITDGTIRIEYAPNGEFVNKNSFLTIKRDYPKVNYKLKEGKWIELSTAKMKLRYKKNSGAFTAENCQIISAKGVTPAFTWKPGMKQKYNLKGTTRTLDGWNGNIKGGKEVELEDGLLAKDGWTFIDDSKNFLFDGDTENWDWVETRKSAEGAQDFYFMAYGNNYKAALKDYTMFAGRVPLPPRYAFGYWWSRYWMYSDHELRELKNNFERYNIPLDVLVVDMDWHYTDKGRGSWTGWTWNKELFPDYRKFLKDMKANNGPRITINLHPAEGVRSYEEQYETVARDNGIDPATKQEVPWIASDKRFINSIFKNVLMPMNKDGIDFWWLDWQQHPYDNKISNLSNTWWLNYIFFTQMQRERDTRPLIYHRWGGLGNHRYQVGFSGDTFISWESLDYQIYFNSTASNVLYGYWSHDIGGHQGANHIDPELYVRWMQFGALSPILRTHSTKIAGLTKEPWVFSNEVSDILRDIVRQRYNMVPYIYTMARQTYETGMSLCRPMYYDYPDAQQSYDYRKQYMFGDNIMVASATSPMKNGYTEVKIWFPQGEWYEYASGETIKGGQEITRYFALDEYPIYMKAGSIIPMYNEKVMNLNGKDEDIVINIIPGTGNNSFQLYEDNGDDKNYQKGFSTTDIKSVRTATKLDITIDKRNGSYKEMPANRNYQIKVLASSMPLSVTVNGKKAEYKYLNNEFALLIYVPERDCSVEKNISVEFTTSNTNFNGILGTSKRVTKAMERLKYRNSHIVFQPDFCKLGSIKEAIGYTPEKLNEIVDEFWVNYKNLPSLLKDKQKLNDNDSNWFLDLIKYN
ncbi:TIM-barrel domain-containing protein [Phocaeicola paurosaccharolyticus]|uniref:glycoside hydrolase family 31 protein n=1 Tax=Phocaeicola paurosaccharolyticus TaxID=732242 RepID=UPI002FE0BBB2